MESTPTSRVRPLSREAIAVLRQFKAYASSHGPSMSLLVLLMCFCTVQAASEKPP
jgi:hypothetical protein